MNRCRICGKILEDETEDICLDCQSFIIDEFE
jgi:rRNA maturation endonuclease Nob1